MFGILKLPGYTVVMRAARQIKVDRKTIATRKVLSRTYSLPQHAYFPRATELVGTTTGEDNEEYALHFNKWDHIRLTTL